MADAEPTLEALRAEIDAIDEDLHRLIMRRANVALRIGAAKNANGGDGLLMRPGREAQVLRRLIARHEGAFPKSVILRLWRELIGAVLRMQGPFSVAVYAPEGAAGYWDLARDHFGSLTPASAHDSAQQVLSALATGGASVGVLPLPDSDDTQPWWPMLLGQDAKRPRVVARLPFGSGETVRGAPLEALAVAAIPVEATGNDRTLLVIEATAQMSRSALAARIKAAGFETAVIQSWNPPNDQAIWLHLVDVEGYVTEEDPKLARLATRLGKTLHQIGPVGGYAVPFSPAELGLAQKG
jgi:chorismate mutase / prephenate dehydratase